MISVNIYACALVLVACTCAFLVWHTFDLRRRAGTLTSALDTHKQTSAKRFATCDEQLAGLKTQSSIALAARVDELSEAVERLRKTHQRFAGRVDQQRTRRDSDNPDDDVDDPTWQALRRAQHIPQGPTNGGTP